MKNLFDGSDDELKPGQAILLMARQISWPTEAHQSQICRALEKEFGLETPDPEPTYADPKDQAYEEKNKELQDARAEVARLKRAAQEKSDADELARLRAEADALKTT